MLVDENGGVNDSLTGPKSRNHTSGMAGTENTGRWSGPRTHASNGARARRSKRSSLEQRQPPGMSYGGGGGGVATGSLDITLGARTNKALPLQMYKAMMASAVARPNSVAAASAAPDETPEQGRRRRWTGTAAARRKRHRKRQAADVIVYRQGGGGSGGDGKNKIVDVVPLEEYGSTSEHRIRVNLTIAADSGSIGGPVYAVSLSLPDGSTGGDEPEEPDDFLDLPLGTPTAVVESKGSPILSPLSPSMSGAMCECFCPCLDEIDGWNSTKKSSTTVIVPSSIDPSTFIPSTTEPSTESYDDASVYWTTTSSATSSQPLEAMTCPPPILMFCEKGKSTLTPFTFRNPKTTTMLTKNDPCPK